MAVDRAKLRDQLKKKTGESYDRKNDSGQYGNVFRTDIEGLTFWRSKTGVHMLDIIPFYTKPDSKGNMTEMDYLIDIWVHRNVGPGKDSFVCQLRTNKGKCPICEFQNKLLKDPRWNDRDNPVNKDWVTYVKSFFPTRRVVYNVICYDSAAEEAKGIQIWEPSHFLAENQFVALAKNPRGGITTFSDPDEGKTISFEHTGSGMTTKYEGVKFLDRDYTIGDEIIEAAVDLNTVVVWPEYEELKETFESGMAEGANEEQEEEEAAPAGRMGRRAATEEPAAEAPTRGRLSRKAAPAEEPVEEPTQEEPAALPAKTPKAPLSRRAPAKKEPEPEPAVEEVAEDECPVGGKFGEEFDAYEDCATCAKFDDCALAKDQLEAAAKAETKPKTIGRRKG